MQTRKYVDLGLLVMAGLSVATAALLLMVVIRALLLIFARVLFSKNRTHFTTITPMETHARLPATCKIDISTTSQLSVDWKHAPLLVKKSFDVDNAAPESLWLPPHAGKWIFSRLANRCWALKRIAHKPSGDSMAFRTSEGARFVTWDIPAGVEVAFRWDSFVAMSESARFGKTVSLKLGTIVLEHVMLPSVRGPGLLIQRTYGEPSRDSASVAPDRLLAWTFGTRFRIEASTRLLSTYLDHCQMRAHADGQALLDAPRERRGSQGLFRELARLVRP